MRLYEFRKHLMLFEVKKGEAVKLIAYHGSKSKNITNFDMNLSSGDFGQGAYFTQELEVAATYGKYVYECEISMKSPLVLEDRYEMNDIWDSFLYEMEDLKTIPDDMLMREYIQSKGFDGIIIKDPSLGAVNELQPFYVMFDNSQITILSVTEF